MKLQVHCARRTRTRWADDAAADYLRRVERYLPIEERVHKDAGRLATEILRTPKARDRLVLLDERGEDLDSLELAKLLEAAADAATVTLAFALGGPDGHDPRLPPVAWRTVRLSAMVLNHAVARVVLAEQLYRACTIRAGEPYHHA